MWLSVVCTLIDNDTRHQSGQNVVDSLGPQQIVKTAMTRIVVNKSTHHAKPHSICFLPQHQRKRKKSLSRFPRLGLESARSTLCK